VAVALVVVLAVEVLVAVVLVEAGKTNFFYENRNRFKIITLSVLGNEKKLFIFFF
jgi:hypothetical protein